MLLGCAYFFFLFSSYFILRPIRDAFAVQSGVSKLPWLFTGTLAAMLAANPIFSALVVRFPVRRFLGITYQFFALNLLVFYVLGPPRLQGGPAVWIGRVFFVWVSVFNLFLPSTFWAFMADHFRSDQAKRLFGFIGVGGTIGSIFGSGVTALLAQVIGPTNLLLISIAFLEIAALIMATFPARQGESARVVSPEERAPIGGRVWAGLTRVAQSRYLTAIAGFVFLYVVGNTVLYFEQTDIVGRFFKTHATRTEFLARTELAAQSLTALTQALLTGRVIRWIGLTATLAIIPALSALGFAFIGASAIGLLPILATYVVFVVLRRGLTFALTNPARETLFTTASREDRFKAKSFIDTFVYRAGDQVTAWTYGGLTALGMGLAGIAWAAVPVSLVFLALAIWLGRRHETLVRRHV